MGQSATQHAGVATGVKTPALTEKRVERLPTPREKIKRGAAVATYGTCIFPYQTRTLAADDPACYTPRALKRYEIPVLRDVGVKGDIRNVGVKWQTLP